MDDDDSVVEILKTIQKDLQKLIGGKSSLRSDDDCLEAWAGVYLLRQSIRNVWSPSSSSPERAKAEIALRKMCSTLHRSVRTGKKSVGFHLSDIFTKYRFNHLECEIVIYLSLLAFGMIEESDHFTVSAIQEALTPGHKPLAVIRALSEKSRLVRSGLVITKPEQEDEPPINLEVRLRKSFMLQVLNRSEGSKASTIKKSVSPKIKLDAFASLVLAPEVKEALHLAMTQAKYQQQLIREWGLGNNDASHSGLTLLFSGPPGVGKTASATALAVALERDLSVVNYSEMQNCYLGETEKNIAAAFRTASEQNAILLWDEADTMLSERGETMRIYEIREVNVLLQELERFSGICILASNRKDALDPALERRIGIKIEFERPTFDMRIRIWEKHLPKTMPLTRDVSIHVLAKEVFTGGEIKNVVWNAARFAVSRNPRGKVSMDDFRKAVTLEKGGRWSEDSRRLIGFGGRGRRMQVID